MIMKVTYTTGAVSNNLDIDIQGNAGSSTKALQDNNGNQIDTTYAPINNPTFTGSVKVPTSSLVSESLEAVNVTYLFNRLPITVPAPEQDETVLSFKNSNVIWSDANVKWGNIKGSIADQADLQNSLSLKADKAETLAGYNISDAYTKAEIDSKLSSVYKYKGSVNSYSDLPTDGMQNGDVYNIKTADTEHGIKAGDNVAWVSSTSEWDVLAGITDLSSYRKASDQDLIDATKENISNADLVRVRVSNLETIVGDSTSGLVKSVNDLENQITTETQRATNAETGLGDRVSVTENDITLLYSNKENKFTSDNAGNGISIIRDSSDRAIITNTQPGIWGSISGTLSAQNDLQSALNLKANLSSPALTGIPTAPTASVSTSTTQIATTAFVQNKLQVVSELPTTYVDGTFYFIPKA